LETVDVQVKRLTVVSLKSFDEVVSRLTASIGRPEMNEFRRRLKDARTTCELRQIVADSVGPSGLMEFARFDPGEILRKSTGEENRNALRFLVGNPLIMRAMALSVPEAAAYAPVSIFVDERSDGTHVTYDSLASLIAPYRAQRALKTAMELDAVIEDLLRRVTE
jgi:uncharacterized protein (DUF302 family)